jgi:cytochrome oxidase Cu insertion factor (SCO1/SenC/PrrC family)
LLIVAALVGAYIVASDGSASGVSPPSASIGVIQDRSVPSGIADLPLQNQAGQNVTLGQFRGKVLLVAPFLTSCQEECPITTAALLVMQRSIAQDGLSGKVVLAEITVDPGRDTPARMTAFAQMTGSTWPLLTGSSQVLARLWKYFGIYYQRVAEGAPPGIDWETHRPYTYDVDHSDGFILMDGQQRERFVAGGMVHISTIPTRIRRLLDSQGQSNLTDPGGGSWTVPQGLGAIGWVLGRPVPEH